LPVTSRLGSPPWPLRVPWPRPLASEPPCGSDTESPRTWVDIYGDQGRRWYGFCGFTSSEGLKHLWFAVPQVSPAPFGA